MRVWEVVAQGFDKNVVSSRGRNNRDGITTTVNSGLEELVDLTIVRRQLRDQPSRDWEHRPSCSSSPHRSFGRVHVCGRCTRLARVSDKTAAAEPPPRPAPPACTPALRRWFYT